MWSTPSRNVALAASELGPTWNTALATPAFGERYSSRSVANGALLLTVPSARLSCSSMYAWTAVPDGYGLSVPSVTSGAVGRPVGGRGGGWVGEGFGGNRGTGRGGARRTGPSSAPGH